MNMTNLNGKLAVITGGNSGIGYATAKLFKENGAKVIITGRSEQKVNEAAADLGVIAYVADQGNVQSAKQLADAISKEHGRVDVLFINAGVFYPTPVGAITEDVYDTIMNINFKGALFTLEAFLPVLNDGASVINLSSVNAYTGMPNTAVYAASKAALNSLTRTAAIELAPRKIRVNAVNPGPIDTPIFGKTGMTQEQLQGFAASISAAIPLQRFGKAEEVAALVTFLASDAATFITGSEINIDGGVVVPSL